MARSGFKMKGSPMQRNFGIGASPMRDEKETKTTSETSETTTTPEVDAMFGQLNDSGTKVVNEQGNWINISKSTEGTATYNRAKAAGTLSGGPDVQ